MISKSTVKIFEAKCATLEAEYNNRENCLRGKLNEEMRLRISEVEERRAHEYSMAMVQVRQGIKEIERELSKEKCMRTEIDKMLKDERTVLISLRCQAEEHEKNKAFLVGHMEEASAVIGRLKIMLHDERKANEGITLKLQKYSKLTSIRDRQVSEVANDFQINFKD